jgi:hypothetical protein
MVLILTPRLCFILDLLAVVHQLENVFFIATVPVVYIRGTGLFPAIVLVCCTDVVYHVWVVEHLSINFIVNDHMVSIQYIQSQVGFLGSVQLFNGKACLLSAVDYIALFCCF